MTLKLTSSNVEGADEAKSNATEIQWQNITIDFNNFLDRKTTEYHKEHGSYPTLEKINELYNKLLRNNKSEGFKHLCDELNINQDDLSWADFLKLKRVATEVTEERGFYVEAMPRSKWSFRYIENSPQAKASYSTSQIQLKLQDIIKDVDKSITNLKDIIDSLDGNNLDSEKPNLVDMIAGVKSYANETKEKYSKDLEDESNVGNLLDSIGL